MTELSESEFRKKNQDYSFAGYTWSAAGSAAFFGAASTVATGLLGLATHAPAGTAMELAAAALTSGAGIFALGAMIAVGLGCMYLSQKAFTELRVIQDEHMAKAQEKALSHVHSVSVPTVTKSAEYDQNKRGDGKTWVETTTGRDVSGAARRA